MIMKYRMVIGGLLIMLVPGMGPAQPPDEAFQTWYVRIDGGSPGQCDGSRDVALEDAAGSGECAWSHPFHALPPGAEPRIDGGDTLIIRPGDYPMGAGAPATSGCDPDDSSGCYMASIPSGPSDRHPTRIIGGSGFDGPDSGCCSGRPELWGTGGSNRVINLDGASHVHLQCLGITDRGGCVDRHCHGGNCPGEVVPCDRDAPGDWALNGIFARDSKAVKLTDLDIHGLAGNGVQAGRLEDWTLERVRIHANGWSGWDGGLWNEDSANRGSLVFRDVEISWNGCAESYPERRPHACWAEATGGYGDGLGTAETAGDWIFEDVRIHHNTSDGLDLLYLRLPGTLKARGLHTWANAGNAVKVSGNAKIADSRLEGDCDALAGRDNLLSSDICRALGSTLAVGLEDGGQFELAGTRLSGTGDCLLVTWGGDAESRVMLVDNHFQGGPSSVRAGRRTCGFYDQGSPAGVEFLDNRFYNLRGGQCPAGSRCAPPGDG